MLDKLETLAKKAKYQQELSAYSIPAKDWRELQELAAVLKSGQTRREPSEHNFEPSGRCAGCGMTEGYLERALEILNGWPENSEKNERIAEINTCKNDVPQSNSAKSTA